MDLVTAVFVIDLFFAAYDDLSANDVGHIILTGVDVSTCEALLYDMVVERATQLCGREACVVQYWCEAGKAPWGSPLPVPEGWMN